MGGIEELMLSMKNSERIENLESDLALEKLRADTWVKAARFLAEDLGLASFESKGSTQDWALIKKFARSWKAYKDDSK